MRFEEKCTGNISKVLIDLYEKRFTGKWYKKSTVTFPTKKCENCFFMFAEYQKLFKTKTFKRTWHTEWNLYRSNIIWEVKDISDRLIPTALASATFRSQLNPEDGIKLFKELNDARSKGLVLTCSLHLCYLLQPVYQHFEPKWNLYHKM